MEVGSVAIVLVAGGLVVAGVRVAVGSGAGVAGSDAARSEAEIVVGSVAGAVSKS